MVNIRHNPDLFDLKGKCIDCKTYSRLDELIQNKEDLNYTCIDCETKKEEIPIKVNKIKKIKKWCMG